MLFNSIEFIIFLPIVFILFWLLKNKDIKYQNLLLLSASYVFYGWWDYRFLSLIIISSLADFIIGKALEKQEDIKKRKWLLAASIFVNVGILAFFKYFGFFLESFVELISTFGLQANISTLKIILPVGISFYTFQTMSYTIDVYRRQIKPTHDFIGFFAFVSFFPQLVAGPIERATNLLPQFQSKRKFSTETAKEGLRQMAWGMFKKVVVADNIAKHVEAIFSNYGSSDTLTLLIGAFLFTFQVYCDFSGYSDIAIGAARLFGFKLMRNFAFPFFSRDIAEFWRRWHISLSTWFRDYIFIPLGGSRSSRPRQMLNIFITFTVSGLWHGANWTYILFGILHGIFYLPLMMTKHQKIHTDIPAEGRIVPGIKEGILIVTNFSAFMFSLIVFRSVSITDAFGYISSLITSSFIDYTHWHGQYAVVLFYTIILTIIEWFQRYRQHALEIGHLPTFIRWIIYLIVGAATIILGNFGEVDFIYFQF